MSFAGKCTEPEILMLKQINQTQKDKSHTFSFIYTTQGYFQGDGGASGGPQGRGKWG